MILSIVITYLGKLSATFLYAPNSPIRFTHSREWIAECKSDTVSSIDQDLFPEVKWEDEEPTEINIEIVNKQQ